MVKTWHEINVQRDIVYPDLAKCIVVPGCRFLRVCKVNWAVFWEHGLVKWRKSQPVLRKQNKEEESVGQQHYWTKIDAQQMRRKKRTLKLKKKKKEVHYIQRKHPHVSLHNFVAPSNISWMTIAKCLPTKYWRRLSSVRHGDGQRLQKLKAPLKTKPTKKKCIYQTL